MKRAIRNHAGDFSAVLVLVIIAAVVGGFILTNERLRFPYIQEKPFTLKAAFSTAQAVTPGQGQTVRVSGIRIGDISKVKLDDGRAIVTMDIDQKYKDMIRTDATALLRPKTGLKDMFVELMPGTRRAPAVKQNFTIPIQNTLPDVNPDEVLGALDGDTRDYLRLLVNGAGNGLRHRGGDLQEVLARFEPTHRDLARVTSAVATRDANLRRLINSLHRLNGELAGRSDQIAQLVDSSATVFRAFASEEQGVRGTIHELPSALHQTTITLGKVQRFANVLRPAADNLRPSVRALNTANKSLTPFAKEVTPLIRDDIRPFVREARPLVRDLRPASRDLATATPDLTRTFKVVNHLFNILAYNQNGAEPPEKANRVESYLFWVAWIGHMGNTLFATADAHSSLRPVFVGSTCPTLETAAKQNPPLGLVLAPIIANPSICAT